MARTVGYLRVSTTDQDTEKFKTDILKFANDKDMGRVEFVEEKISGLTDWRKRKLGEVVESLQSGDKLIVPELSRLGRSLVQVLTVMNLLKAKGVSIYGLKEGFVLNGSDVQSKIMSALLALFSEIERDLISVRTKEALAARKAQGVVLGRRPGPGKSKLDPHKEEVLELLKAGVPKTRVAKRYGTSALNLAHWLKVRGITVKG